MDEKIKAQPMRNNTLIINMCQNGYILAYENSLGRMFEAYIAKDKKELKELVSKLINNV